LTRSETSILKTIIEANDGMPALVHIPNFQDSFMLKQDGVQKNVNVYQYMDKNDGWCSIQDVLNSYPDGIDLRDAAWMFNRILSALLMAHQADIVHAAVVPSHFMLHLPTHGGVLIDWSYAVPVGTKAKAISQEIQRYMPPEILNKQPLTFGTDIYMAANILLALVGGSHELPEYPPRVRGLFRACQLAQTKRLNNVTEVYEDFSEILKILYGPRTFRPFKLKE
jgi:serine/threonine protein kinase